MRNVFIGSYLLLSGLVFLEALTIRAVLMEVVRFKRLREALGRGCKSQRLSLGSLAPEFTAPLLGTNETVSSAQFKGNPTILLFVSSETTSSPDYWTLSSAIHAFWHKDDGNVDLVCHGDEDSCNQIAQDHRVSGFRHNQIPIILDKEGRISQSFLIDATPAAIALDSDGRVRRYGRPVESPETVIS